jgi:signal transduction histidine kinase
MAAIAGDNLGRPAVEALPVNVTSVMGMVAKTRQPVMIADVREPPWSKIYYPLDHGLQMRAELAVPLLGAGGRLVGVLNLESPQVGAFTEADSHLLQSLASQAVIAIQQVRLVDALRDTSARVLTQEPSQVVEHLRGLREELVSGDPEWDRKVDAILAQYETLARDNAARQQALAEAQEARAVAETFAAMGDIAANLLHHLNNQVGTIPARVEGIQDKCAPQLAQSAYLAANLAEIERAALAAMRTVRERLALLRPITIAPVSIAECLDDALKAARLPGSVSVTVSPELPGLPPVMAGREGLSLVLLNLLDNAGEALGESGAIIVSGSERGEWVEVAVSDDGPGIPPEMRARIFEFGESGRRRGARSGRLGFGLWWVKTLLTRLGGTITVESDGAKGTTFRLRLPKGEQ